MSCGCSTIVTGSGGANPPIDPQACNAITNGPNGLLVPQTEVTGVAVNAPGTGTPVDVFVTPTPGCPDAFSVSAEVTIPPVGGAVVWPSGEEIMDGVLLHNEPAGTDITVPGSQFTLTEPGVYEITADMLAGAQWVAAGPREAWVQAHIHNDTAGADVFNSGRTLLQLQDAENHPTPPSPGYNISGANTLRALVTITGPTNFSVNVSKSPGTNAFVLLAPQVLGAEQVNHIVWRKVSD